MTSPARKRAPKGSVGARVLLRIPEALDADARRCAARAEMPYSAWLRMVVTDAVLRRRRD